MWKLKVDKDSEWTIILLIWINDVLKNGLFRFKSVITGRCQKCSRESSPSYVSKYTTESWRGKVSLYIDIFPEGT